MFGGKGKDDKPLNDSWIFESDTETWTRPTVVTDVPVPALFHHAALAVNDPHSNCSCKQSVLVLSAQDIMWSHLWQIRCVEDRSIYEWRKIKFQCNATCKDPSNNKCGTCPVDGKAGLSVSIVNEGVVIVIAKNGLWKYDYLQQNWTLLQAADSSGIAPFKKSLTSLERAVYLAQLKRYVIFGGSFNSNIISYSVDTKEWEIKSAFGHNPAMASLAAVVDGNITIAYGGTSATGCHQSLKSLIRTAGTWIWIRYFTVPVQPNLAPQFVLGGRKNRMYVCGESVRLKQKGYAKRLAEMWKFNVESMQWWKVRSPPEAGQRVCGGSRDYYQSVPFQGSRFVIFGSDFTNQKPPLHIYRTSNNTWQTQTTRRTPQPRQYHSMSSYNETVAFLFGGRLKSPQCSNCWMAVNDLWTLHYEHETLEWILIHSNTKTRNYPPARIRHAMVVIGTTIYVYGGYAASYQVLNDLWLYDILRGFWTVVKTVNPGPVARSSFWISLATTVVNQMIMTLGCFDEQSNSTQVGRCNITKPQETWLYSPESKRWMRISETQTLSDIFEARSGPSTPLMYNQGMLMLLNVLNVLDRARIHYMAFACPKGYYSNDTTSKPCRPCPTGKYSNSQRDGCRNCPNKLTTTSPGMHSVYQCSQCEKLYCTYGKCLLIPNKSNVSNPKCECTIGFTGDYCDYPTYYLIALGIVSIVILTVLLIVYLVNAAKRKQRRERKLRSRVEELLSAWQIRHEEITLQERVGSGASGQVYRSVYREITVAVKMFNMTDEFDSNSEVAREIRFMQTIRHPNIVLFIYRSRTNCC